MYPRFNGLSYAANVSSNAFKNLGGPIQIEGEAGIEGGYRADTTLRLDSFNSSAHSIPCSKGIKRKWSLVDGSVNQETGSSVGFHLGRSSSSSDSKGSSATRCTSTSSAKETDEESSLELDFTLHIGNETALSLKRSGISEKGQDVLPKVDLELSLFSGHAESDITVGRPSSSSLQTAANVPQTMCEAFQLVDEGTVSSWRSGSSLCNSLSTSPNTGANFFLNQEARQIRSSLLSPNQSCSVITNSKSSITCTSGVTKQQLQQQRSNSTKQCQFQGCTKGARGASGLCIAHGGGRRCQKHGCHKGAEGRTAFCKAHGGGRRCEFLGCTKSAEGRTDFCIAHGGGRRCSHECCTRAARGKSGLCIRHGGGKRCQKENCTKSAEGLSGLCISHGGGRRCQYPQCTKGAQGSTMFCKAHGGGKRCTFEGCTKGAEGSTPFCKGHGGGKRCSFQGGGICTKSVHGGTLFCVAHGGGKRCAVPECTKSARGRTDFCVRHGGGKRCQFEGCEKSAQGSTDFCKAHGGGKRCSWGHPSSEFGMGETPCTSFARGKAGLCASHGALVQDKRVHGGATLGVAVQQINPNQTENTKEIVDEDMDVDTMNVDRSIVTSTGGSNWKYVSFGQTTMPMLNGPSSVPVAVPEGRVHGGSLMSLLASK